MPFNHTAYTYSFFSKETLLKLKLRFPKASFDLHTYEMYKDVNADIHTITVNTKEEADEVAKILGKGDPNDANWFYTSNVRV